MVIISNFLLEYVAPSWALAIWSPSLPVVWMQHHPLRPAARNPAVRFEAQDLGLQRCGPPRRDNSYSAQEGPPQENRQGNMIPL